MASEKKLAGLEQGNSIDRTVQKIGVPAGMSLDTALEVLDRERRYQEERFDLVEDIPGAIFDAAYAVFRVLVREYGFAHSGEGAASYTVPTGPNGETVSVPWGSFKVPGINGTLTFHADRDRRGRWGFKLIGQIKRKEEGKVRSIAAMARDLVRTDSLYKGKAIRVEFSDEDGEPISMIEPAFLNVSGAKEENLILSAPIQRAVATSIFTPIRHRDLCKRFGIPTKRGVLLAGTYGTGKTLTAMTAANLCEQHGWTFVYIERAGDLKDALRFAAEYAPALVFCEDADEATDGGRDEALNAILNTLDGVDTKGADIMTVLTTNNAAAIDRAMMRPGRLDDIIEFLPPDADAVSRLIRHYGAAVVDANASLLGVSAKLAGQIPAVIRECVERAKLDEIRIAGGEIGESLVVSEQALLDSADSMQAQIKLMRSAKPGMNAFEAFGRLSAIMSGQHRLSSDINIDAREMNVPLT